MPKKRINRRTPVTGKATSPMRDLLRLQGWLEWLELLKVEDIPFVDLGESVRLAKRGAKVLTGFVRKATVNHAELKALHARTEAAIRKAQRGNGRKGAANA
jgi:hypothetical protein